MKKTMIPVFLVSFALSCAHAQASDTDSVLVVQNSKHHELILHDNTQQPSYFIPNYAWGSAKPIIRLTQNPYVNFDGKIVRGEPWPRLTGVQSINEQQVDYIQNYETGQRRLLESLPVAPYLHFEKKNSSAGILFWFGGRVNMFMKIEW